MVANTPSNSTFFAGGGSLVCLTFYAQVHNMIAADGAVVDDNVPSPKSYSIPLFDFELLSAFDCFALILSLVLGLVRDRRIAHLDVGHGGLAARWAVLVERSGGQGCDWEVRAVVDRKAFRLMGMQAINMDEADVFGRSREIEWSTAGGMCAGARSWRFGVLA